MNPLAKALGFDSEYSKALAEHAESFRRQVAELEDDERKVPSTIKLGIPENVQKCMRCERLFNEGAQVGCSREGTFSRWYDKLNMEQRAAVYEQWQKEDKS
jgi:hypothetical protein